METYITICKTDSEWKLAVRPRELKPGALYQPRGWEGKGGGMGREEGGRFKREGVYVYPCLIHVDVWQKPTQFCKAFIFQI